MTSFFNRKLMLLFCIYTLLILPYYPQAYATDNLPAVSPRPFLTAQQYNLLQEILNTHLNFFLSKEAITSSGFPLGAYNQADRGKYNYSNSTEWGYTILAWITAADRGIISVANASSRIEKALDTMIKLQNDPTQNYQSLFYPYYYVTTRAGVDLITPYHDSNLLIPSVDNGFLYTSLVIAQGWANTNALSTIETKALSITKKMNFRIFFDKQKASIKHFVNASNGQTGPSQWDVYADEGGMMAWIAYMSDSITLDEYKDLIDAMKRSPRQWNNIIVKEAAWFNAMFTWGVRSLSGFPVAKWETGLENQYSSGSFANVVKAHLAFGNLQGAYYPAFSDAMTQPNSVGFYTPPNLPNEVPATIPAQATPHAFFIPFNIGPDLDPTDVNTLISKISDLKNDLAHYYHNGNDNYKPFGFEVTVSTAKNNTSYRPPTTRFIFETLSAAYTVLSIQQGLNINDGKPTFLNYATKTLGYFTKVQNALSYLYPSSGQVRRVPTDYSTIQAAIDASSSGDTILVAPDTYNESLNFNKSGVTLTSENQKSILNGSPATANITASNLFGDIKARITGFTITGGSVAIQCLPTVSSLQIDNNLLSDRGILLEKGATVTIKNNTINNCEPIIGLGQNIVQIIGNTFNSDLKGALPPGISLKSATGLVQDNNFYYRWDGALKITDASNLQIMRNRFLSCGSWDQGAGILITNSTATIENNIFTDLQISNLGKGGAVNMDNSTVTLYNNIFYNIRGKNSATTQGVVTYAVNSNVTAKNNIFMNNINGAQTVYAVGTARQDYSYNDFWNNTTSQLATGITLATNNIYSNPRFIDTTNFLLNTSSPAINAGDPDNRFNDLNGTRNDMGIYGGSLGNSHNYILNLTQLPWRQNIAPYSSTAAASSQMIIDYMREGVGLPSISQKEIYEYAKSPQTFDGELNADQIAKVIGHFDPYDSLVNDSYDPYDSLLTGNPYQGYNFSVNSLSPSANAINEYMRNISHSMAFTVKQGQWWTEGPFVIRPNTPSAVALYGNINHWVAINGFASSNNPAPFPITNPSLTPNFSLFGFWIKDPLVTGIGQDSYKTAPECALTYFLPLLSPEDTYNGKYVHVAQSPAKNSNASITIEKPLPSISNLDFVTGKNKTRTWRDIVDKNLWTDTQALNAFENTQLGEVMRVHRPDIAQADYYLVPFIKVPNISSKLASAVILINAQDGSFKEASWTKTPERIIKVSQPEAIDILRNDLYRKYLDEIRNSPPITKTEGRFSKHKKINISWNYYQSELIALNNAKTTLIWEPRSSYSLTAYQPYWQIELAIAAGYTETWYVTQEKMIFKK